MRSTSYYGILNYPPFQIFSPFKYSFSRFATDHLSQRITLRKFHNQIGKD